MLEAVNSVLQTAPLARAQIEQVSVVDSFAANPERAQRALPQAPYVSPYIYVDVAHNKAILQLRNGETGDVEGQFPSDATLEARARAASLQSGRIAPPSSSPAHESDSAQAFVQNSAPSTPDVVALAPDTTSRSSPAATAQQQAAFAAAARSGNSNAGSVTLFA